MSDRTPRASCDCGPDRGCRPDLPDSQICTLVRRHFQPPRLPPPAAAFNRCQHVRWRPSLVRDREHGQLMCSAVWELQYVLMYTPWRGGGELDDIGDLTEIVLCRILCD